MLLCHKLKLLANRVRLGEQPQPRAHHATMIEKTTSQTSVAHDSRTPSMIRYVSTAGTSRKSVLLPKT